MAKSKITLAACLVTALLVTSGSQGAPKQDASLKGLAAGDAAQTSGQNLAAIEDYVSAYDASIGDVDLTAGQLLAVATKYSWALLQNPKTNRPKMIAFAEALLLDRTTAPAIRALALTVAGKLLNRDIAAPKGDIEGFCEDIAAQLTSPVQPWNAGTQGAFIVSMAAQGNGRIWIGTEDNGLWLYDPLAGAWRQFTTKDGLGDDDIYAICTDKLQRIWVGHLNHGVSVFNGEKWQNYDPLTGGPRGERVFSLAMSPVDGDVWAASSAGLCRYSVSKDTWTYYDRSTGLPSDQAQAIVFDKRGTLYVGTDCDGIAIGTPRDNYATWRRVTGPNLIPNAPEGDGIPSNQINCLLADSRGTIWAGTPCGLAHSGDSGVHWTFKRGRDWADKVGGQWHAPEVSRQAAKDLLAEDYVSCLTENADGLIYIGYRADNFEVRDPVTGQRIFPVTGETVPSLFLSSLLPVDKGYVLLGRYGDGVQQELPFGVTASHGATTNDAHANDVSLAVPATYPPLPSPLKPLTQPSQIEALAAALNSKAPTMAPGDAYYEGPDWATEGDYEGHYGTGYAVLCSGQAPVDNEIWGDFSYHVTGAIGPHADEGDGLRHWIHWANPDNQKCLWDPVLGHRRQAEWDDHGESYAYSHEGPDVWAKVTVPAGIHRVSLYFMNKDGHDSANRYRNYMIEIKPHEASLDRSMDAPTLAHARVVNFWGGVYHRFIVCGPATYDIRVSKNGSMNAILSAVLLDRLEGKPERRGIVRDAWLSSVRYEPAVMPNDSEINGATSPAMLKAGTALYADLDNMWNRPGLASTQYADRIDAYRAIAAQKPPPALLENWRWKIHMWTSVDRDKFLSTVKSQWAAVLAANPKLAKFPDR